ncbi:hypothetical protein N7456_007084 [Penicillium angulare]|uniref:WSC domain-containing protein n=1 Tax=Penicillium angulare TaxID=116970 RepID=A0A9W9FJD6_9EURO|nr:hypothetical protein N7456_007084 [Penicillium angulare]
MTDPKAPIFASTATPTPVTTLTEIPEEPLKPTIAPHVAQAVHRRDLDIQAISQYSCLGCYQDNSRIRVLNGTAWLDINEDTPEFCCEYCRNVNSDYTLCGVENSSNCFCDSTTQTSYSSLAASDCNSPCAGGYSYACGGFNVLGIYSATTHSTPSTDVLGATSAKTIGGYRYMGCYTDFSSRILQSSTAFAYNEPGYCCKYCANQDSDYRYCGVENEYCFCDSTTNSALLAAATACSVGCRGDGDVQCGGHYFLNLYTQTGQITTTMTDGSTTATATRVSTSKATSSNAAGSQGSSIGGGAIAGIVVGVFAVLGILAGANWFLRRRRNESTTDWDRVSQAPEDENPAEIADTQRYEMEGRIDHINELGGGIVSELHGDQTKDVEMNNEERHELGG